MQRQAGTRVPRLRSPNRGSRKVFACQKDVSRELGHRHRLGRPSWRAEGSGAHSCFRLKQHAWTDYTLHTASHTCLSIRRDESFAMCGLRVGCNRHSFVIQYMNLCRCEESDLGDWVHRVDQ